MRLNYANFQIFIKILLYNVHTLEYLKIFHRAFIYILWYIFYVTFKKIINSTMKYSNPLWQIHFVMYIHIIVNITAKYIMWKAVKELLYVKLWHYKEEISYILCLIFLQTQISLWIGPRGLTFSPHVHTTWAGERVNREMWWQFRGPNQNTPVCISVNVINLMFSFN